MMQGPTSPAGFAEESPKRPRLSAHDVSDYLDLLAKEEGRPSIAAMHRQKILVLIQAESVNHLGAAMFCEAIEAWEKGPVVRSIWERFKYFAALFNRHPRRNTKTPDLEESELIQTIWDRCKIENGALLSERMHRWDSWNRAWKMRPIENGSRGDVPIPPEEMAADATRDNERDNDEFRRLAQAI